MSFDIAVYSQQHDTAKYHHHEDLQDDDEHDERKDTAADAD